MKPESTMSEAEVLIVRASEPNSMRTKKVNYFDENSATRKARKKDADRANWIDGGKRSGR